MTILSKVTSRVKNDLPDSPTEDGTPSSTQDGENPEEPQPKPTRPILEIMSYDRFTPPSPTPDLEYDCRITNNPSPEMCKTCTGVDAALQDELMSRSSFRDLIARAEHEIRNLMEANDVRAQRAGETAVVRVGCLCGSGRHRSVAFAEKLRQVQWCEQGEWEVRVKHRNLRSGVEGMKRIRGEKSRSKEGKGKEKGV